MFQSNAANDPTFVTQPDPAATTIPAITRAEATALATAELDRFLALIKTLEPQDWAKPTACTAWCVRDILAHQAGAYASFATFAAFRRHYAVPPKAGKLPEDVANEIQLADRANHTPAELIAELEQVAPIAIANRARLPLPVRLIALPRPQGEWLRLSHLLDEVYTRDTWMHRLDIARATGRPFFTDANHDGRIVALVMRELDRVLAKHLRGESVRFLLRGTAGGAWLVGQSRQAQSSIEMDVLDFNIYASGRYTYEEALAKAQLAGNLDLARSALRHTVILY